MGICVLILITTANVNSQPPSPSSRELSSPEKPQPSKNKEQPQPDQRGTEKTPLVIKMAPSPNAQEEVAQAKREKEDKAATELRIEITSDIVAFATFIQAVALIITVIVMTRTARRQLRAYIAVDGDKEPITDGQPGELEIHMVMKNVGQTPAFKLNHWVSAAVLPFPLRDELPNQEPDTKQNIYVPPGMVMDLITKLQTPWTRALLDTDIGDSMCFYVWGEVHYVDIFDKPRFVKFRFMRQRGQTRSGLEYCLEGNEAN